MKQIIIIVLILIGSKAFNQAIDNIFSGYVFTKEDSIRCDVLTKDWRGNIYMHFKKSDTQVVKINVYDSNGFIRRISALKVVNAKKLIVAQGDEVSINPIWEDADVSYLKVDKQPIRKEDIY